jgi:hypothetical protein
VPQPLPRLRPSTATRARGKARGRTSNPDRDVRRVSTSDDAADRSPNSQRCWIRTEPAYCVSATVVAARLGSVRTGDNCSMLLLILLIILIVLAFGGGFGYGGGAYRGRGIGLGGILLIVLVVLLLTGNLGF